MINSILDFISIRENRNKVIKNLEKFVIIGGMIVIMILVFSIVFIK